MNDILLIDDYLFERLLPQERLMVDARLLTDPQFKLNFGYQSKVYELVKDHGQKNLRKDIVLVEKQLFSENRFKNFREIIYNIFK